MEDQKENPAVNSILFAYLLADMEGGGEEANMRYDI